MLSAIRAAVETGRMKKIEALVEAALSEGCAPAAILDAMEAAMTAVGDRFQRGEMFIPELLVSAKTMQKGVGVLKPLLLSGETGRCGKLIIGTARGDMHDIGKNLVALMAESVGFEVLDLGVDVTPEGFVSAVEENPDCRAVGVSALLTTTMDAMGDTLRALEAAGLRERVRVLVGGAPVTADFASEIGADAYTPDAGAAAARAKELTAQ